jgi:hypothetical protein
LDPKALLCLITIFLGYFVMGIDLISDGKNGCMIIDSKRRIVDWKTSKTMLCNA